MIYIFVYIIHRGYLPVKIQMSERKDLLHEKQGDYYIFLQFLYRNGMMYFNRFQLHCLRVRHFHGHGCSPVANGGKFNARTDVTNYARIARHVQSPTRKKLNRREKKKSCEIFVFFILK